MHDDILNEIKRAVESSIEGSQASASSPSGGHFEVRVKAAAFTGKTPLQQQRMVLTAISHLMKGDNAPVHAVDKIHIEV